MRDHRRRPALRRAARLALLAWLVAPEVGLAELYAEQITAANVARRQVGGPDAIAGIGDWALGNGVLCAAVSSPDHESVLTDRGGILIDLGHCGRRNDQWGVLQPVVNLSRENVIPVERVAAERDADEARIVTEGGLQGLRIRTVYALDHARPTRLRITSEIERTNPGEAIFLFGDIVLHGHRQLSAFTLSLTDAALSPGFEHPAVDVDDALAMVGAMVRADCQVLVGGGALSPQISYGLCLPRASVVRADGREEPVARLALNGEHFSILGAYADTLWLGGDGQPGLVELAQTPLMDLEPGERLVLSREIVVGERADVAAVTSQLWSDGPLVQARVGDPAARLRVLRDDGAPVTFVRPGQDGVIRFRLPRTAPADYRVLAARPGGEARVHPLHVGHAGDTVDLGPLDLAETATLRLPAGTPMRLVARGVAPTPDPVLGGDGFDFTVGSERIPSATESAHVSLAGRPGDPDRLVLAPGRYRLLATRGPEWSVSETVVELAPGETRRLEIAPPVRVLEPAGWVSADFHVHAAPSDDSAFPLRQRIAAFAAQGADVIVATEHDNVWDYAPLIRELGLDDRIASLVGVEITSTARGLNTPFTSGHANAFPLVRDPTAYRGGAPRGENVRLRSILADLRARHSRPILQLNHPRERGFDASYGSYFTHLAVGSVPFDPVRPLNHAQNRALVARQPGSRLRDVDFDAVELLNGPSMTRYRLTRADWLSLLRQGEIRTATANSDSHSARELVALPRNYVAYAGPTARDLDVAAFMRAVRAGRLYGSTGPLLDATLGGRGPGERYAGSSGELRIRVRSADWVPAEEVRVFVNGALRARIDLAASGREIALPLRFGADAFVTVEVEADPGPADSLYALLAPGFTPFAFTNPIFVDADLDGLWTPPGLAGTLPPSMVTPLESP